MVDSVVDKAGALAIGAGEEDSDVEGFGDGEVDAVFERGEGRFVRGGVAGDEGTVVALGVEVFGKACSKAVLHVGYGYVGAVLGEFGGCGGAEAGCPAGDEDGSVGEEGVVDRGCFGRHDGAVDASLMLRMLADP